ncbi:cryptochrome/photolyase family protein [Acaricomes phytoseiuli]|uniref:cryptochrome/photolyase family protein n=1 Tax=Acaricomes phytoseiuli TaxID=291968 RepID=UPI0003600C4C|nr:deoxyribodipyrimidine photo-lyase [Acaricomes phytoseiuli]
MATLVWLRDDLRLADNPALHYAAQHGALAVVYLRDEESAGFRPLGGATRWWLHHSLTAFGKSLVERGLPLLLRSGPAEQVIPELAAELGVDTVVWNRRYGGPERAVDSGLKRSLRETGVHAESFAANLLFEPWTIRTGADEHYKVFTPFWRACQESTDPRQALPEPDELTPLKAAQTKGLQAEELDNWGLLPQRPDWSTGLAETWTPGEVGAKHALRDFLSDEGYAEGRDYPALPATSMLSPHLRFGELSPFQIWQALGGRHDLSSADEQRFRAELCWREFCWHLLYHHPDLATENYRREFDRFEWAEARGPEGRPGPELRAWQRGATGYPLVDAGMRELWRTGWMHNRVRMAAASFLAKNLLIDWREGERWFWDTLVDADAANNPANWQWVAGSGADASPYFRIFNPVTQSKKFDRDGRYLRRYLPELAELSNKQIHEPWKSGAKADYPEPLIDLKASRAEALERHARLKQDGQGSE